MTLSIIIPCYNEAENIPLILKRFGACMKPNVEVVLVNNGSTDNSRAVMDELVPQYPFARVVTVEKNQGYGYGILQGLKSAKSDYIGWTHADMQTDPKDVLKGFEILCEKQQTNLYIKGRRKNRPLSDRFFTFGMGVYETLLLHQKLYDINAQPNIFPRSFFEEWQEPPYDFALDLYALSMANVKNLEIIRFDVLFPERIHGQSHWNTGFRSKMKFIKRTLDFSKKLKKAGIK